MHFGKLLPDTVLDAVASLGLWPDGRLFALNSYENRVYRIGLEEPLQGPADPGVAPGAVVAKFYRPGRWSDAQIVEEHDFALELTEAGLPVARPWAVAGRSLHRHAGFRFAVFTCQRGATPELSTPEERHWLGRSLARLHQVGARRAFRQRRSLQLVDDARRAAESVLASGRLPDDRRDAYRRQAGELLRALDPAEQLLADQPTVRLHGDCHVGNLLWHDQGPVFVDFDDALQGPAIQDMWLFLAADPRHAGRDDWQPLLDGYQSWRDFDPAQLALVEPLRALRLLQHSAWLAARWDDPAFPVAFPVFGEAAYWDRHLADLRDAVERLASDSCGLPD